MAKVRVYLLWVEKWPKKTRWSCEWTGQGANQIMFGPYPSRWPRTFGIWWRRLRHKGLEWFGSTKYGRWGWSSHHTSRGGSWFFGDRLFLDYKGDRIIVLVLVRVLVLVVSLHFLEVFDNLVKVLPSDLVGVGSLISFPSRLNRRMLADLIRSFFGFRDLLFLVRMHR